MHIAIIGTGNVGTALASGLGRNGHRVVLGSRHPGETGHLGAKVTLPHLAAELAEVVVLALPWVALEGALHALGDLAGKVVIDCTNPIGRTATGFGLMVGHDTSGGELVQGWLPKARVVKTLNQVGAEVMADTSQLSHPPAMFMAGNDDAAKGVVGQLLTDLGFQALDAGNLTKARLLEPLGMVWINQALMRGKGRDWAFAAVSMKGA